MNRIFSGSPDFSRINPLGIVLMAVAVLAVMLAGKISLKMDVAHPRKTEAAIKILSLVLCACGALLAILG